MCFSPFTSSSQCACFVAHIFRSQNNRSQYNCRACNAFRSRKYVLALLCLCRVHMAGRRTEWAPSRDCSVALMSLLTVVLRPAHFRVLVCGHGIYPRGLLMTWGRVDSVAAAVMITAQRGGRTIPPNISFPASLALSSIHLSFF
jgi:hypothetical protein